LALVSTLTPAGKAKTMAGMTSLNPSNPNANLLSVSSYKYQPKRTGTIFIPIVNMSLVSRNKEKLSIDNLHPLRYYIYQSLSFFKLLKLISILLTGG
jgi:hypothetical protein